MSQITACVPDKLVEALGAADPGDYLDGFSLVTADPTSYESNHLTKTRIGQTPI